MYTKVVNKRNEVAHLPLRIEIIAPYASMVPQIEEALPLFDSHHITYHVGNLEEGVTIAQALHPDDTDIIISRGGTAQLIRDAVTIPVIDLQISGYDMIRSLTLAKKQMAHTAIVGFSNITSNAQSIMSLFEWHYQLNTVTHQDDVLPLLFDLKEKGIKQVIGDVVTVTAATKIGLQSILITSGTESLINAITEATHLANHFNKSREIKDVFEALFSESYPNYLLMDSNETIVFQQYKDYQEMPLSDSSLRSLIHVLQQRDKIKTIFKERRTVEVLAQRKKINQKIYYLLVFSKDESEHQRATGIRLISSPPLYHELPEHKTLKGTAQQFLKRRQPLTLVGENGVGKKTFARVLFFSEESDGNLLEVDTRYATNFDVSLENVHTLILKNIKSSHITVALDELITRALSKNIQLILTAEEMGVIHSLQIETGVLYLDGIDGTADNIVELTHFYMTYYHEKYHFKPVKIADAVLQMMQTATYPHHLITLRKTIKLMMSNETKYVIGLDTYQKASAKKRPIATGLDLTGSFKDIERQILEYVLTDEDGNQTKAAERLNINRATLWRKLKD